MDSLRVHYLQGVIDGHAAGITGASKLLLMPPPSPAELEEVQSVKDQRIRGFEEELQLVMRRRQSHAAASTLPSGACTSPHANTAVEASDNILPALLTPLALQAHTHSRALRRGSGLGYRLHLVRL